MACTGTLASTVGLLVLISLTNGQSDINKPLPACNSESGMMAHPNYAAQYIHCNSNTQTIGLCAEGTIWDTKINNCNHISQAITTAAPCSASNAGTSYPMPCCDSYLRCNGAALARAYCPTGQVFNAQSGLCGSGSCTDQPKCSRNLPPTGPQAACNLVAVSGQPCSFRMNNNGTLTEIQNCGEGTGLDLNACTCVTLRDNPCMRSTNSSGGKTPDAQCRANLRVDFNSFRAGTNIPQAISDKTGAVLNEHIQAIGVQYGNAQATLTTNTLTTAQASFYIPYYSSNRVANNFVVEVVFRATQAGTFEAISNNRDGACAATFSFNVTATGNGGYSVNGIVTGFTETGVNQQITNTATISNVNINVGQTEFVLLRFAFTGRVSVQLINRGQSGTGFGQIVNSPESGNIGEYLAYNSCGIQFARGLNGIVKSFAIREACINVDAVRT